MTLHYCGTVELRPARPQDRAASVFEHEGREWSVRFIPPQRADGEPVSIDPSTPVTDLDARIRLRLAELAEDLAEIDNRGPVVAFPRTENDAAMWFHQAKGEGPPPGFRPVRVGVDVFGYDVWAFDEPD